MDSSDKFTCFCSLSSKIVKILRAGGDVRYENISRYGGEIFYCEIFYGSDYHYAFSGDALPGDGYVCGGYIFPPVSPLPVQNQ